ncbi:hypothetical protein D3C73_1362240 [compost metagenome]
MLTRADQHLELGNPTFIRTWGDTRHHLIAELLVDFPVRKVAEILGRELTVLKDVLLRGEVDVVRVWQHPVLAQHWVTEVIPAREATTRDLVNRQQGLEGPLTDVPFARYVADEG